MKLFLDNGWNPREHDALSTAVQYCCADVVRLLLEGGARADCDGALWTASRYSRKEIVQVLLEWRNKSSFDQQAARDERYALHEGKLKYTRDLPRYPGHSDKRRNMTVQGKSECEA